MWPSLGLIPFVLVASVLASQEQALLNSSVRLTEVISDIHPNHLNYEPLYEGSSSSSRLVMYVQTLTTASNEPLSLLPLLEHQTKITHIILGSLHLHEEPGIIMLNNDPLDSHMYRQVWAEVKILQKHGVKVLALLGGAAGSTYERLSGSDEKVSTIYFPYPSFMLIFSATVQQLLSTTPCLNQTV